MNRIYGRYIYALGDLAMSYISWSLFFLVRKTQIEGLDLNYELIKLSINDPKYILGSFIIPFFWVLLHYSFGSYKDVFRKSRLK